MLQETAPHSYMAPIYATLSCEPRPIPRGRVLDTLGSREVNQMMLGVIDPRRGPGPQSGERTRDSAVQCDFHVSQLLFNT